MFIRINNKEYKFKEGETILDVCRRNEIKIPTLCASSSGEKLPHESVCRLCLVEIMPDGKLTPSCITKATEEMEISTESEQVKKARNINMELLWADHAGKCATCKKNQMCELQKLAEEYQIENFRFVPRKGEMTSSEELDLLKDNWTRIVVEEKNPCIARTTEFCVECRRCINICPEKKFGFNYRAGDIVVGTPYEKELECSFCGKCVEMCPTAALMDQNDHKRIIRILDNAEKISIAIVYNEKENNLDKLGFEKIIKIGKGESLEEKAEEIKTKFARKEKINPEEIAVFVISNDISKKKNKSEFVDYVLTEREIKRLIRDKK